MSTHLLSKPSDIHKPTVAYRPYSQPTHCGTGILYRWTSIFQPILTNIFKTKKKTQIK